MNSSKNKTRPVECVECGQTFTAIIPTYSRYPQQSKCRSCKKREYKRIFSKYPDKWYNPDNDKYEIALYTPTGERRYYKHRIHAAQRLERWYSDDVKNANHTLSSFTEE